MAFFSARVCILGLMTLDPAVPHVSRRGARGMHHPVRVYKVSVFSVLAELEGLPIMLPAAVGSAHPGVVHLNDVAPRSQIFTRWDRARHHQIHWFSECFAEFVRIRLARLYRLTLIGSAAGGVLVLLRRCVTIATVFPANGIHFLSGLGSTAAWVIGNVLEEVGVSCTFVLLTHSTPLYPSIVKLFSKSAYPTPPV